MRLPDPPFVLLDDAREGGTARLYADPVEIVAGDVTAGLRRLREARGEGLHAGGWLTYEGDRLWFGLFRDYRELSAADVVAILPDPAGAWAGAPEPRVTRANYGAAFAQVAEYIAAGDIYQANLTFRAEVPYAGGEATLYALLRQRAGAGYGALVATGEDWMLSFSPELFFGLEGGELIARPMKGTAIRGADPAEDIALAEALASDEKQRAENLMIVDLMRNDMARVSRPGSVAVPKLFHVERYPTVHQMVSDVTAELAPELDAIDALEALFPCGSVTGAPKIRAMKIIEQVESDSRGIYTGAIGRLDADGNAMFNVAIRTLARIAPGRAVLGLGSGVVADSLVEQEWQECLAKGAFVTAGEQSFDLIETMRFDPLEGILLLERHLARMKASATALGFEFDRHAARNDLQAATFRLREASRVRLLLSQSGMLSIGTSAIAAPQTSPVSVAVVPLPVASDDFRLRHKTTRRGFYDRARIETGSWEVVFTDAEGFLTEGSFTNIFVERAGVLLTPPLDRGLLPGVLRAELIETGRAIEDDLTPEDLANGFFVGNALRGLVAAVTFAPAATAPL